jgi:hypothetical protein
MCIYIKQLFHELQSKKKKNLKKYDLNNEKILFYQQSLSSSVTISSR